MTKEIFPVLETSRLRLRQLTLGDYVKRSS
ncbi:UNVERIFIED_CONTAM: hypothetical protein ABIC26_001632 [Paenibacillus sp. PvR008]